MEIITFIASNIVTASDNTLYIPEDGTNTGGNEGNAGWGGF